MALSNVASAENLGREHILPETYANYAHVNANAVSWAAILAGAAAAAALSLILLLLGAGLGLSSVSPWAHKGVSASTFGVSTIVWVTVTQVLAAGMGGYLAGRLRIRWAGVQADEVYFRDTAHGFLAWAVATLATAILLASAIGSIVNGGVQAAATLTGGAATAAVAGGVAAAGSEIAKSDNASGSETGAMGYFVDSLFRKDSNMASATSTERNVITTDTAQETAPISEVTRIFINSMNMKTLPPADITYISQLVSRHTGLAQQEAEKRVNDIYANIQTKKQNAEIAAKDAADKARKASIYATLWLFVSLLMGAFSASLAATWGGRCRDA
ncbi:MAG: hypothetical protein ABIU85_06985 [Methylotenera sp.]